MEPGMYLMTVKTTQVTEHDNEKILKTEFMNGYIKFWSDIFLPRIHKYATKDLRLISSFDKKC